jgi:hypothetical protein
VRADRFASIVRFQGKDEVRRSIHDGLADRQNQMLSGVFNIVSSTAEALKLAEDFASWL